MKQGKLIIFSAPSGSGKSTIVNYLISCKDLNLGFSISATSRTPRQGEKNGKHYYFLKPSEFKKHINRGDFLEYEEVYENHFYGTFKSELDRNWSLGNHVVFDIDVLGGLNIKSQFSDACLSVFIKPPSIEELKKRLELRGTDSVGKIKMRLDKAEEEMQYASKFDVVLENDILEKTQNIAYHLVKDFILV